MELIVENQIKSLNLDNICPNGDITCTVDLNIYNNLIASICKELTYFYNFESSISCTDEFEEETFYVELSEILREIGCTYPVLCEGTLKSRFNDSQNKLLVLNFLLSELCNARILAVEHKDHESLYKQSKIKLKTTDKSLTSIVKPALVLIGYPIPPENITTELFFKIINDLLTSKIPNIPRYFWGKSLLKNMQNLTDEKWHKIEQIINILNIDYKRRKDVSVRRVETVIQGFRWSEKGKLKSEEMIGIFDPILTTINEQCGTEVNLTDLLSARDYPVALIDKVSNEEARAVTACKLNKIKIGPVPDRGGRCDEMDAPPPEMPAFQKRDSHSAGGYRPRGGYDNQRGGGGYNQERGSNNQGYRNNSGHRGGGNQGFNDNQRGGGNQRFNDNQRGGGNYRGGQRVGGYDKFNQGYTHNQGIPMEYLNAQNVGQNNYYNDNQRNYYDANSYQPQFHNNSRGRGRNQRY